jgi:hypothetical protein
MTTPVENLKKFVRCSQLGEPPEKDVICWLGDCLNEVLVHRVSSFEEAFGLQNLRGGVPWWLESAMQERNKALRELARCHLADQSRTQQARKIATLSSRYMASAWRFDKNRPEMPARYKGRPQEWLWQAFKSGASMPLSERQLRNIL